MSPVGAGGDLVGGLLAVHVEEVTPRVWWRSVELRNQTVRSRPPIVFRS
jgi:hypothetical protein